MAANESTSLLTVQEVRSSLKLSHTKVSQMIQTGELPSLKIGRSRRVRAIDLKKYLEDLLKNGE